MQKHYLPMRKKLTSYNWRKSMKFHTEMDSKSIEFGEKRIKKMKLSFLSVKTSNHFSSKDNILIVITGIKFVTSSMEGHFNTFTTGFNITPIKTLKKEDGLLFKISNSLFLYNILEKRNGQLSPKESRTEVKFKSGKDSVTFLIPKSPKIHGPKNKFRFFKIKPNNLIINGEESFNCQYFRAKQTIFYGESLGL